MIRFNGPKRSCQVEEIQADLKLLRVMMKTKTVSLEALGSNRVISDGRSPDDKQFGGTNKSSHLSPGVNHNSGSFHASGVSRDLLEQLPNTVSVSFININAHELVAALGDKVKYCMMFIC